MPKEDLKVKAQKPKAEEKTAVKKAAKEAGLSVPVYSLDGKEAGKLELAKEVFGVKVNRPLMSQAIRVYLNNLKAHWSSTKTRGEVSYSTRKLGAQKGSGHARHGSLGAPIYVGGGIALGPKFRKVSLDLPKKMKRSALFSALSQKASQGEVVGVAGLDKASGKTAEMNKFFLAVLDMKKFPESPKKKNLLLVVDGKNEKVAAAVKNLKGVDILSFDKLNTLNVIAHKAIILTKEATEKLAVKAEGEKI